MTRDEIDARASTIAEVLRGKGYEDRAYSLLTALTWRGSVPLLLLEIATCADVRDQAPEQADADAYLAAVETAVAALPQIQ